MAAKCLCVCASRGRWAETLQSAIQNPIDQPRRTRTGSSCRRLRPLRSRRKTSTRGVSEGPCQQGLRLLRSRTSERGPSLRQLLQVSGGLSGGIFGGKGEAEHSTTRFQVLRPDIPAMAADDVFAQCQADTVAADRGGEKFNVQPLAKEQVPPPTSCADYLVGTKLSSIRFTASSPSMMTCCSASTVLRWVPSTNAATLLAMTLADARFLQV